MQIGIIYIGDNKDVLEWARTFMKELASRQCYPTIINTNTDTAHISAYPYLIFFIETDKIFKKKYIGKLDQFLKNAGMIRAKFASIFVNKGFMADRKFLKIMKRIEKEGLILHETSIIYSKGQAEEIAKRIEPIK
jgi:hypothetical protein